MLTKNQFQNILTQALRISRLEIIDDSAKHKGHSGAKQTGGGHYFLLIVSDDFAAMPLVKRHKKIYDVLKPHWQGNIHALALKTYTVEEFKNAGN